MMIETGDERAAGRRYMSPESFADFRQDADDALSGEGRLRPFLRSPCPGDRPAGPETQNYGDYTVD